MTRSNHAVAARAIGAVAAPRLSARDAAAPAPRDAPWLPIYDRA